VISVREAPPEHYPWIAERAHLVIGSDFRAIEAVDEAGRILGMVGYDGWCPGSVAMHVALDNRGAARRLLQPAFGVPFIELKIPIIKGLVLSNNPRAIALDKHLGFKEVARLADWWAPGVDIILFEMRREDCRWIPSVPLRKAG
jgi:RimJ/RimL family protein N-acetyltransferase